jgi:ketopantoate hydroxymethyltransferase
VGEAMRQAVADYRGEVGSGRFPGEAQSYT